MEISKEFVQHLIDSQFPDWKNLKIVPVAQSGHDNRTFHLGENMTVRLPSAAEYVPQIEKEARWLPVLQEKLSLPISRPIALGKPVKDYPFPWSVNLYLEGETASEKNISHMRDFASQLSRFLKELQGISAKGAPLPGRHNFFRGADPAVYRTQVESALQNPEPEWPVEKNKKYLGKSAFVGMGKSSRMAAWRYCAGKSPGKKGTSLRGH